MTDPKPEPIPLSAVELEVLRGMSHGMTNQMIGKHLGKSENKIKDRARVIFRKLSALDRAHATRLGFVLGLLTAGDPKPGEGR